MIELPKEQFPHGVCPLMSIGTFIPVKHTVEMRNAATHSLTPALVPCLGEQCQLWNQTDQDNPSKGFCVHATGW